MCRLVMYVFFFPEYTSPFSQPPIKKLKFSLKGSSFEDSALENANNSLSSGSDELLSDITTTSNDSPCTSSKYVQFYIPNSCCTNLDTEIWQTVYSKDYDLHATRSANLMAKHEELKASHRVILLDWIMEICDLYKVSRDTYYLTLDYLDRFLSGTKGVKRRDLQLVGITCLFIASKVEEVKSITVLDLVHLTDFLYTEEEVFQMEQKIIEIIKWRTSIWTANKWLFAYLHVINRLIRPKEFMQLTELLDMATLDIDSMQFSYSVLAATCLYTTLSVTIGLSEHSQLNHLNVCKCNTWISKFWDIVKNKSFVYPPKLSASIAHRYRCKIFNYSVYQLYNNILEHYKKAKNIYNEKEDD